MLIGHSLDDKTFRGTGTGIQEGLVQNIERSVGQGGEEGGQFMPFTVSFRMARICADNQHSAGKQQIKGFTYSLTGRFPSGGDPVIPSGKPAQIKNNSLHFLRDITVHVFVTAAKQICPICETFLTKQGRSGQNCLLLDIKSINTAGRAHSPAEEDGVVSVSHCRIHDGIAGLYCLSENFPGKVSC